MIAECIAYTKSVLTVIGVQTIYDKPSDVSRFKGSTYALITVKETGKTAYDGNKIAYIDDYGKGIRTYHIRRYKLENALTVRFVDKTLDAAESLQKELMKNIATGFVDAENYRVEVAINAVRIVQDEAVLASGAGVELDIVFSGGIYITREVKLITSIIAETEIIQTKKEAGGNGADTENGY